MTYPYYVVMLMGDVTGTDTEYTVQGNLYGRSPMYERAHAHWQHLREQRPNLPWTLLRFETEHENRLEMWIYTAPEPPLFADLGTMP
ncbi:MULTISPECIES: hypothetical protein [Nocardia]|uniref:hypothetical protein n=1 Tax=Nocardia TaxID=1817 RepID=UPI0007A4D71E|nr:MULTISPECIES: hypothetical protein [Nocardia]